MKQITKFFKKDWTYYFIKITIDLLQDKTSKTIKSLLFSIEFLQKFENPKGQSVREWFFNNSWSESLKGLSSLQECLNLLVDTKFWDCMFSDGKALNLGTNYFERMGKWGADHPWNHSSHEVVDTYCFCFLIKCVI